MRIRGARKSDFRQIDKLAEKQGIVINVGHLKTLIVATDEDDIIIGFITLETILEASIVTNTKFRKRDIVVAIKSLLDQGCIETQNLGFDKALVYTTNNEINRVLQRKFNFEPAKGEPLIGRVDRYGKKPI